MILLHLIKKDILIAKKFVLITMLIVIAIPLFFMWAIPSLTSFLPFLYIVILVEVMLLQTVSQIKDKNPKVSALLCATPYTRKELVKARYAFFILLFAYCYIVHTLLTLIIDPDLTGILAVLLCSVFIYGIYMPIEFKYGLVKAKFIFMATVLILSLGPIIITNLFAGIDFSMLVKPILAIPAIVKCALLASLSALFFGLSMAISINIFSKKEL